jgi:hypothetical protein
MLGSSSAVELLTLNQEVARSNRASPAKLFEKS